MKKVWVWLLLSLCFSWVLPGQAQSLNRNIPENKLSPHWNSVGEISRFEKLLFLVQGHKEDSILDRLKRQGPELEVIQIFEETGAYLIKTDMNTALQIAKWPAVDFMDIRNQLPREELAVNNFDL